jgi:hypothetical protein
MPEGVKRRAVEAFLKRPGSREMTQQELADACDVDQSYVSRLKKRSENTMVEG